MKARILAIGLPATVMGAVVGAGWWASKLNFIPPVVWHYLWPALIAFGFLALSVGALLIGAYRWLWPLGTGFVVQSIGLLLLWGDVFEASWEPLVYTASAVAIVLLIMFIVWVVATLRARWLEKKMIDGVGGIGDVDQQKLAEIRKNMLDALTLLKRAGLGRNAIYELPWFLVIGRSQAGKTVAIKNSGLGLPVKKDRVKGVGGTHTCDWFFTNDLVFLDTPGAWVTEGADDEGQQKWIELLRLLRKYRGRRPLDGLVVVVPADDLLSKSDQDLQEQAANIRQVVDTLHDELRFRFPVYLVVSKSDLVEGFVDFFRGIPAQRRSEILGWSNPDPTRGDATRLIPRGFHRVAQRLKAYRLDMLARIASVTRARRLFFFTEEFKNLERPLELVASVLFEDDPYHERPVFRGFYFTSGTQGEGSPLGQAMAQLAGALGVRAAPTAAEAGEEEPKRSYFLLDVFRELMLGDHGLVSRTAVHWWRARRDTMFVVFLPAVLAVFLFGMSCCSFLINGSTYSGIRTDVPAIVSKLDTYPHDLTGQRVLEALDLTEQIRTYHRKLTGFNPLRGFGMRRPGDLPAQTFKVFREQLNRAILIPTLRRAEEFALDPEKSCTDRIDVFYSVVYLRRGHKGEWSDDLKGLEKVWNLSAEQAAEARHELLQQFTYIAVHGPSTQSLLPGMSLAKVAGSIAQECRERGPGSALDQYTAFQEDCSRPATDSETTLCREKLMRVLRSPKEDYARLRRYLDGLKNDLEDLRSSEPEAEAALHKIELIPLQKPTISECLGTFNDELIPAVEKFMSQKDLIDECKSQWEMSGRDRTRAMEVVQEQEKARAEKKAALFSLVEGYTVRCADMLPDGFDIDVNALAQFGYELRLITCMNRDRIVAETPPPPPPQPAPGPRQAAAPRKPPVVVEKALRLFTSRHRRPGGYSLSAWADRQKEWNADLQFAQNRSPAQRERAIGLLQQRIEQYAAAYAAAWKSYLEGLRVGERRGAVPGWLSGLGGTPEYARLLRPAAQAVPEDAGAPPFDALGRRMESLRSLRPFVETRLAEYQSALGQIGKDLEECEKSSAFWTQYRGQVAARDRSNNLVKALEWVDRYAGSGLAEGRLRDFFLAPLQEAENYVESPDLTLKQWGDLLTLYRSASSRFPFTTDEGAGPVDVDDFTALLGGQSGVVPVLAAAAANQSISERARAWLARVAPLSGVFFDEGSDELRPFRLKLAIEDPVFEPPDLEKDYMVQSIVIYLGEGLQFEWKDPEPRIKTLNVALFGDEASTYSFAAAIAAERKGAFGRAFGKNYKEPERRDAVKVEGPWAPVRLLDAGLPGGLESVEGNRVNLVFAIEVPYKRKQPGQIKLRVRAEGNGLPLLIQMLKGGVPAPPASITGE